MTREFLKQASKTSTSDAGDVRDVVQGILDDIERGGDEAAKKYAAKFDDYDGNLLLSEEEVAKAVTQVSQKLKDDIAFAHDNVRRFAEVQKQTIANVELEVIPGFVLGQRSLPCQAAACYIPGGRYSHIAVSYTHLTLPTKA